MSDHTETAIIEPPRRRLELALTVGADTLDDLADALQQIATDLLIEGREAHDKASGGYRYGYSSHLSVDPDMDGDRYRREVTEHVRGLKNGSHTRTSTTAPDAGPDYCAECSERTQDWVPWPCENGRTEPDRG